MRFSIKICRYQLFLSALVLIGASFALPEPAQANESSDSRSVVAALARARMKSPNEHSNPATNKAITSIDSPFQLKGWDYLFARLISHGFDPAYLATIFGDSRMPKRDVLRFRLKPREPRYIYRGLNTKKRRENALNFYREHREDFEEASSRFGVPPHVLLAIVQVETGCGTNTGRSRVFHRLARLASAAAPDNVEKNYREKIKRDRKVKKEEVLARALRLEEIFFPHLIATLTVAERMQLHPLDVRGSYAGAIGIPQFLPGNIARFGVDADGDGRIDLFSPSDAIFSVASFLSGSGWQGLSAPVELQRKAVWAYNPSQPYVDTVLAMAKALEREIDSQAV